MKALSRLTLSLALVGLACTEHVIASTNTDVITKFAGNADVITKKLTQPTATTKDRLFHIKKATTTTNTVTDDGQGTPPSSPDNGQSSPSSPDDGQSTPPPADEDDGSIKWAPPTTDNGMSL
jgi:hypothetical protein